jgi:hypothetical protein
MLEADNGIYADKKRLSSGQSLSVLFEVAIN